MSIYSIYARYHSNMNDKKKLWSSETQNMPREVSFNTTESEDSSIKLATAQTPYLYSLILQIWHNKRVTSRAYN